jgi:CRISPR-associated protein Cst2
MSFHLFGLVVTPHGVAANNRGENEGNITTLQKILWNGEVYTTVSAEAIRFAIRKYWQSQGTKVALNRTWDDAESENHWDDPQFAQWADHIDDDVLGFMSATAAKEEGNEAENGGARARGTIRKRRARLEITRSISLTPFAGDITFNAASPGATPSASRTGRDPVPYGTEVHATRYQYGFALTPESLQKPSRAISVVQAIFSLASVAGNHARFLFDFAPESVVLRWTSDFAPRILYGFESSPDGRVTCPTILRRIESGDLNPSEMVIGGPVTADLDREALRNKGVFVSEGVGGACDELLVRMRRDLKLK